MLRKETTAMRINLTLSIVGATLALSMPAITIMGHHSFAAEFDANKPVTLRGTVTKVERVNPHGWIHMDVKDQSGKVENWAIETAAPGQLARRGIRKDFPPIGMEIVVTGYRAKDGTTTANGATLKTADGKDLFVGSSGPDAPPAPVR
jgi:hypothetical protein